MIANNCNHEFKHLVLIAEFDIRPPEEGLGKKADVEYYLAAIVNGARLCMLPR
jgi:hypothetical protein